MSFVQFFKRYYYWLLLAILYAFIVFSPFLRGVQRVHDSYLIEIFGYAFLTHGIQDVSIDALTSQGRPFSSLFYRALTAINPPQTLIMSFSVLFSLIFFAFCSFLTMYMLHKYNVIKDSKVIAIIAFFGSISLFFNMFILDSFLFYENWIMSAGSLFTVLAILFFLKQGVVNYMASFILLLFGVFSYQASVAYFMPIIVLFLVAKHSSDFKQIVKYIFLAAAMYAAALLANYGFILIVDSQDVRVMGEIDFIANLRSIWQYIGYVLKSAMGFTTDYVFALFLCVFFVIIIVHNVKNKLYTKLLLLIFAAICLVVAAMLPHLPMAVFYVMPRSAVSFAGIAGLLILCIVLSIKEKQRYIMLVMVFCGIFVIFIASIKLDAQKNNYANNMLDMQEISNIAMRILEYERTTGIDIIYMHTIMSTQATSFRSELNNYHDITIRILSVPWMIRPLINNYLGRYFEADWSISYYQYLNHDMLDHEMVFNYKRMLFVEDRLYLVIK